MAESHFVLSWHSCSQQQAYCDERVTAPVQIRRVMTYPRLHDWLLISIRQVAFERRQWKHHCRSCFWRVLLPELS